MNKREVIEEIKERFDCNEEAAQKILKFGLSKGHIKKFIKLDNLISYFIFFAVVVSATWALIRALQ